MTIFSIVVCITVSLKCFHHFWAGSVQGSTGASTGVADSEWMKRLESNITELKQRIVSLAD